MADSKRVTEEVLSWIIGSIFLYAGVLKLLRPDVFLLDIQSYKLVPYRVAYFASYYLPALEIMAGVGMLNRRLRGESTLLLCVLTNVFIIALGVAWVRGLDISCGCFGGAQAKANYLLLIGRDLLIAAACVVLIYIKHLRGSCNASF